MLQSIIKTANGLVARFKDGTSFKFPDFVSVKDLSFSATPAGWTVIKAKGYAIQDPSGVWIATINIEATATSFSTINFTIAGVAPIMSTALATDPNSGTVTGGAHIQTTGIVRLTKSTAGVAAYVSGSFICSGKPTF